jgi:hypothetical protein
LATELAEDAVVIMNKKTRPLTARTNFADLLFYPSKSRAFGHVEVDNTSRSKLHDYEYVNNVEECGVLGKKITSVNLSLMVSYESSPFLTSLRIARMNHVPSNRARRMLNTEFDLQFLVYFVFSPSGILSAYPIDVLDVFTRYSWPTDLIGSRSPTPEQLESLTVPTDYGIWLCDD